MTEIEPFRGLRYDPSAVDPSDVIAPPYDVVEGEQVEALLARSPHNIAHVESCPGTDDSRYRQAAETLGQWLDKGVLYRDNAPAYYVYEQRFTVHGTKHTRRVFFARLRLPADDEDYVRPHEATLSGPKEDRLKLLRETRTNVSPIFGMFADDAGAARGVLDAVTAAEPEFEATDGRGEMHRLWVLTEPGQVEALTKAVASSPITIADGHHRYQTALNYRGERGGAAGAAPGEQYILAGLVPVDDPGLVVLPIHRLIRGNSVIDDLPLRLEEYFEVQEVMGAWDAVTAQVLWAHVQAGAHTPGTFGVIGLRPQKFHLLTARSQPVANAMPAHWSAASRSLHVLILNETILQPLLGLDAAARAAGERIAFTEDVDEAWRSVDSGACRLAFLVNPVRVEQIVAVAAAGELLPQKSTFFYPKLATGMVLNPLD